MIVPPSLNNALEALQYSTINYFPAIYEVPEAVLKFTVPGKMYDLLGDFSFLRTAASSVTLFFLLICTYLILKALSLPEINRFKQIRLRVK
jgi:hypothetical protein